MAASPQNLAFSGYSVCQSLKESPTHTAIDDGGGGLVMPFQRHQMILLKRNKSRVLTSRLAKGADRSHFGVISKDRGSDGTARARRLEVQASEARSSSSHPLAAVAFRESRVERCFYWPEKMFQKNSNGWLYSTNPALQLLELYHQTGTGRGGEGMEI